MANKEQAPKGKGKRKPTIKKVFKNSKVPLKKTEKKKPTITLETAITFLQSQGLNLTPEHVEGLAELATIPTNYTGIKADGSIDTSLHLKKLMLQSLEKCLGIVTTAAKMTGISRQAHYEWMDSDEEYRNCVHALAEVVLDFSEEKLHELIAEKNATAIIFHLKTKGKKRGYIETVHNMNQTFDDDNVHFYLPDNGRDGYIEAEVVPQGNNQLNQ